MDYFNYFIESYVHNGAIGVLVELDVSDPIAKRTDVFKALSRDLAIHVAAMNPRHVDDLLSQPFVKDPTQTVEETMLHVAEELRAKIVVRRFVRWVAEPQRPTVPEPPRTPAVIFDLRRGNEA